MGSIQAIRGESSVAFDKEIGVSTAAGPANDRSEKKR
jgi:hypothetical protein